MNANLFNCEQCGCVYVRKRDEKLCSDCSRKFDELYFVVRRYLREHPNKNVMDVADALNLNVSDVLHMVGQGRIKTNE